MDVTVVMGELDGYIRNEFLDGDPSAELTASTPLLEWGILNSMNTARLITFVRERFDARVPPKSVNSVNFRNVESIAKLVVELCGDNRCESRAD